MRKGKKKVVGLNRLTMKIGLTNGCSVNLLLFSISDQWNYWQGILSPVECRRVRRFTREKECPG